MLKINAENAGSMVTHWLLYYWDGSAWQTDGDWHLITTDLSVPNGVNWLGCYTQDFWGNVSSFYMSDYFDPVDNQTYDYDIQNGAVSLQEEILFRNFRIESWLPNPAILEEGDVFRATCIVEYIGEYDGGKVYMAIGKRGATFDEILHAEVNITFPARTSWMPRYATIEIPITDEIEIGENYDVYAKLRSVPGPDLFDYQDNIVDITGIPEAEFRNFRIHSYSPTTIKVGDTFRMTFRFEYQGPQYTSAHIKAEVGNDIGGVMFSQWEKDQYISCGPDESWQEYEIDVDIPIDEPDGSGLKDIKGQLKNVPGSDPSDKKLNVVDFVEVGDAEFDDFRIVSFSPTQIKVGDTVEVNCSFKHRGEAKEKQVYVAIGKRKPIIGFDEYYNNKKDIATSDDYDWETYQAKVNVYINEEVSDTILDLYTKLDGVLPDFEDERTGVFTFAQMGDPEFASLAFGEISPTDVKPEDTVMMECTFEHRGAPYLEGTIYASIGKIKPIIGFDEYTKTEVPFQVEADIDWRRYSFSVGVIVPDKDDDTFDIYFKLKNVPGSDPLIELEDALNNQGGTVTDDEFQNLAVDFEKEKPAGVA